MAKKKQDQAEQQEEKFSPRDLPFLRPEPEPTVYIVNPAGAVHQVSVDHAVERLQEPGFREATDEQIDQYHAQAGIQVSDFPIAEPHRPPSREELEARAEETRKRLEKSAKREGED